RRAGPAPAARPPDAARGQTGHGRLLRPRGGRRRGRRRQHGLRPATAVPAATLSYRTDHPARCVVTGRSVRVVSAAGRGAEAILDRLVAEYPPLATAAESIGAAFDLLDRVLGAGQSVLVCGNGGS